MKILSRIRQGRSVRSACDLLRSWSAPAFRIALAAGMLVPAAACTRRFYRNRADDEVSEVLANKDKYPDWKIDNWHVYPDSRARFADSTDPDHPPKPPDDPASYDLSPNPQKPGKEGVGLVEGTGYLDLIAKWDQENRARQAEFEADEKRKSGEFGGDVDEKIVIPMPQPTPSTPNVSGPPDAIADAKARSLIDITDRPTYLLTLDQAAELAMFNSREYQDQRENLYLAALPVTQERFSFMGQTFAASEAIRGAAGSEIPGGPSNNWSLNNGVGISKVLPTAGLLLFSASNQTVFDFLQPKKTLSMTTVNFNAIQPFLRGGGQAVALESLTQAERNLIYQIRNYARFRKELYVEIASNNGGSINGSAFQPTGVLSNNNSSSGSGLGASGLNPGSPPLPPTALSGPILPPSSPGRLALNGALTPTPSGYLNTMLQKIQVYIDQENIDVLSGILLRFRGLLDGDVVGPLQVQSVEQQLLAGRATLLTDQQQYLAGLNSFKLEIGVPMGLNIEMDDSLLRPLMIQFRRSRAIIENEQTAVAAASALIPLDQAPRMRAELLRLFEKSAIVRGTAFATQIRGRWNEWEKLTNADLTARLTSLRKETQKLLDLEAEAQRKSEHLSSTDAARLKFINVQYDLGNFERALRLYEGNFIANGKPKAPDAAGERQRIRQFQGVISAWQKVLVEPRDDQWVVVRNSWPLLPSCCVDGYDLVHVDLVRAETTAGRHALESRLDLMNTRAQLVDSWRQLAVYANALMGTFTAQYQLTASSPSTVAQPLNVGGSATSHQLIFNTELPLVRIQERNNYRASLIAYQRQRRTLQEAEDLAVQAVHNEVLLLRLYADQYKLQQRQLELAYLTIDSSLESLQAPTAPPAPIGQSATRSAADGPAALTQQLLAAQRSLPTAQNGLLTIWINYLDARLQLYRDLELMPLDARGVWIDEVQNCDSSMGKPQSAPPTTPANLPGGMMRNGSPTEYPKPMLPEAR